MQILARALLLGACFGLAAATVESGLNLVPTLERGFGPSMLFLVRAAALQIALGGVVGLLAAPVLLAPAGRWLHAIAVGVVWYGLERWVEVKSPVFAMVAVVVPAGGALLVLLGLWISRRRPLLAGILASALFAAAVSAPALILWATRPEIAMRAELPPPRSGAPDVVLVVLDTVRAGSVSTYGYGRPTAPALDALAREGALFADATSPSTWSLPSHASLFTGRYPSSHGAHSEHLYLDDRYPTLADVLQANGYETFLYTANGWISDGLGLTRGFASKDDSLKGEGGAGLGFSFVHRLLDRLGWQDADKGGDAVATRFEEWARGRPPAAARPAFVFLNFVEAHFPYHQLPHEHLFRFTDRPYGELRQISLDLLGAQFGGERRAAGEVQEPTVDMYDGGIVYSNELLARVVAAVRARGTLDRTVLVVLADHGEVMGERGGFFGHGPSLYQEAVGVPLLVRYPPAVPPGVRVEAPVSTVGVFATILDLAGLAPPPTLQVGSLAPLVAPLVAHGGGASPGPIFSELHDASAMAPVEGWPDPQMQVGRRYRLYREGSLKLVTTSKGASFLYDLAVDPRESRDLSEERPEDLARMQERLAEVQLALGLPELDAPLAVGSQAPELDAATQENLRALGYAE